MNAAKPLKKVKLGSRFTMRGRLVALFGAIFALAMIALIVVQYAVLSSVFSSQPLDTFNVVLDVYTKRLSDNPGDYEPNPGSVVPLTEKDMESLPEDDELRGGIPTGDYYSSVVILNNELIKLNKQTQLETLRIVSLWSVGAFVVAVLLAVATGWFMSARALKPLRTITATARRVADNNLHERISLIGPQDELKELSDTFDEMLGRLNKSFDAQRNFAASASHELRTPLTINRTMLEVAASDPDANDAMRELCATLLTVNERQVKLIEGLLVLASAGQAPPSFATVKLSEVVEQVLNDEALETGTLDVQLDLTPNDVDTSIPGDNLLLEQLVRNLLENAIRYNNPGGFIRVSIPNANELTVENSGPVVSLSGAAELFEPFRRLNRAGQIVDRMSSPSAPGVGLGLSIVRAITEAHSGQVTATPRAEQDGGGLVVHVQLGTTSTTS